MIAASCVGAKPDAEDVWISVLLVFNANSINPSVFDICLLRMPATLSNQLPSLNNYSTASYFTYMSNVPKWILIRQSDYIDSLWTGGTRLQLVSCSRDSFNHNFVH